MNQIEEQQIKKKNQKQRLIDNSSILLKKSLRKRNLISKKYTMFNIKVLVREYYLFISAMFQKSKRRSNNNIEKQRTSAKVALHNSQSSQISVSLQKRYDTFSQEPSNSETICSSFVRLATPISERTTKEAQNETQYSLQIEEKQVLENKQKAKIKPKHFYKELKSEEEQLVLIEENKKIKKRIVETQKNIKQKLFKNTNWKNSLRNYQKVQPFPIKIHLTRLDLYCCGEIPKTIKILQQEEQFATAFIMVIEKGVVIVSRQKQHPLILRIPFESIFKTNLIDNCLIMCFNLENTNNTNKTLVIKFNGQNKWAKSWYLFVSCVQIMNSTSNLSMKWQMYNIQSTSCSNKVFDIEQPPFRCKDSILDQCQQLIQEEKSCQAQKNENNQPQRKSLNESEKKPLSILKKTSENRQRSNTLQKNSVKINQVPTIVKSSELEETIKDMCSRDSINKEDETINSPCFHQLSDKVKQKIKQKEKILELAKQSAFQDEIYWQKNQKSDQDINQSSDRSPLIPHFMSGSISKKRRTEYTEKNSLSEQIRRKVNTNEANLRDQKRNSIENQQVQKSQQKFSLKHERQQSRRRNPSSKNKSQSRYQLSQYYEPEIKRKKKHYGPDFKENMEQLRIIESRKQVEKMLLKKNINEDTIQSKLSRPRSRDDEDEEQEENSESSFSENNEREEDLLKLQQLKNGIVLWKCSYEGWKPHQKKLYISSENDLELCYSDISNSNDEKRIFLQDIDVIEHKNYGKGIIKHMKGKFTPDRCMTITYHVGEKKKTMEFMLSDKEPVYHFTEFYTLLKQFVNKKFLN